MIQVKAPYKIQTAKSFNSEIRTIGADKRIFVSVTDLIRLKHLKNIEALLGNDNALDLIFSYIIKNNRSPIINVGAEKKDLFLDVEIELEKL